MTGSALVEFLQGIPWFAWVAIVAIVGGTISSVAKSRYRHAQRMEMIRQGMDPSAIKDED